MMFPDLFGRKPKYRPALFAEIITMGVENGLERCGKGFGQVCSV